MPVPTSPDDPHVGIDRESVEAWIAANVDGLGPLVPPVEWARLPGGHSNLTYRITDAAGTQAVVRRPPLGELLPKAHDMNREFRIISALWDTDVPVAQPYGFCADVEVTGAPFYVMGFAPGKPLGNAGDPDTWLPEPARRTAGFSFAETLAALHHVDPVERGLGDLGRHDDFAGRQLKAWYRSWTSSAADAELDDPRVHSLHDLLQERKPPDGPVRLVHGDFGIHNSLVDEAGHITAVLDWEVASLGEPMADLSYLLNQWVEAGEEGDRGPLLTAKPGFGTRRELLERYVERAGPIDQEKLTYFVVLNHWRSACIVHGVYTRYKRGQKSSVGVDMQRFVVGADRSLTLAERAAQSLG